MTQQTPQDRDDKTERPLGRTAARELTPAEIASVSAAGRPHTNFTGARTDNPGETND